MLWWLTSFLPLFITSTVKEYHVSTWTAWVSLVKQLLKCMCYYCQICLKVSLLMSHLVIVSIKEICYSISQSNCVYVAIFKHCNTALKSHNLLQETTISFFHFNLQPNYFTSAQNFLSQDLDWYLNKPQGWQVHVFISSFIQ